MDNTAFSRAEAWAAMPSPRPVKPRCSVVQRGCCSHVHSNGKAVALRTIGKCFNQRGGVSFSAGTAIENDHFLRYGVFPP